VFIVANEANVSMLRDEKIRVVEPQWIVPLTAFSARRIPSLAASLATHSGWRNQAITRNIKGAHFAVGCDCWRSPLTERSAVMNQEKYIGMDVHQATISVAVMDSSGKLIMECILETKAATIP